MAQTTPQHRPHCAAPNEHHCHVRILTHATTPTVTVDKSALVASVANATTGDFLVTLNHRYAYVVALPSMVHATDDQSTQITTRTEGTASANSVTVTVMNAGTPADLAGTSIDILFVLVPSA